MKSIKFEYGEQSVLLLTWALWKYLWILKHADKFAHVLLMWNFLDFVWPIQAWIKLFIYISLYNHFSLCLLPSCCSLNTRIFPSTHHWSPTLTNSALHTYKHQITYIGSLMYYNNYAFSNNGKPTIIGLDGNLLETQVSLSWDSTETQAALLAVNEFEIHCNIFDKLLPLECRSYFFRRKVARGCDVTTREKP